MNIKFLSLTISLVLYLLVMVTPVSAQEITPTITTTPTPVVYELPYPGLLPGSPFYFLKAIRDNLTGFFTSDALKKAEFDLHQADKQVAAAMYLSNQQKDSSLVLATLVSAEHYFADALQKAQHAKKQGMDTKDLMKRMRVANLKHQEVVNDIVNAASAEEQKKLESELKKFSEFAEKTK